MTNSLTNNLIFELNYNIFQAKTTIDDLFILLNSLLV